MILQSTAKKGQTNDEARKGRRGPGDYRLSAGDVGLPKDDREPQQDKRLVIEDENHKVVLVAPLTDFELAYLHAVKLGKDDENGRLH